MTSKTYLDNPNIEYPFTIIWSAVAHRIIGPNYALYDFFVLWLPRCVGRKLRRRTNRVTYMGEY